MKISVFVLMAILLTTGSLLRAQEVFEYPEMESIAFESPKIGLSLEVDYLYWEAQEEQLYPVILTEQSKNNGLNLSNISPKNQKFEYTSGFRVAAGYEFPCKMYDIKFSWTRIHPKTTGNYAQAVVKGLIAMAYFDQTQSDVPHAESVVSHWHLNYDMLDLELGFNYAFTNSFSLRPHIGLKGGWIDQTQKMVVNNIALGQPTEEIAQGTVNRQNDFNGIGPSVGLDMRFALGSQFGLFGTVSGALLYGKFDLKNEIYITDVLGNEGMSLGPELTTLNNSEFFVSPTVQILLGGDWTTCLYQTYWIRLGAAYEVQYWWNQMRTNNSVPQALFLNSPSGNLMMHGLTLQVSFEF